MELCLCIGYGILWDMDECFIQLFTVIPLEDDVVVVATG